MKFHPYAEIFPWLEGAALDELAADIKANGLREPIWLYEGRILDGRNRFAACERANVKPDYRPYEGDDPLAFVVSANIHRRHLTESQRAMAAAEIATLSKGSNQHSEGVPIGTSSKMMHASERSTKRAKKVIEQGSKALTQAVKRGDVAVSKAASVVDLPKREQLAAATATAELDKGWVPDEDEGKRLELAAKEYDEAIDKVMLSDDKLSTANDQVKRLTELLAVVTQSRDGYQNRTADLIRSLKSAQRKSEMQEKQIRKLEEENQKLRERVAIMEAA